LRETLKKFYCSRQPLHVPHPHVWNLSVAFARWVRDKVVNVIRFRGPHFCTVCFLHSLLPYVFIKSLQDVCPLLIVCLLDPTRVFKQGDPVRRQSDRRRRRLPTGVHCLVKDRMFYCFCLVFWSVPEKSNMHEGKAFGFGPK